MTADQTPKIRHSQPIQRLGNMVRRPTNSSLIPGVGKTFVPSIKLPRSSLSGAHRNLQTAVQNGSGWGSYQLLFGHQYIKQTLRLYCCIAALLYCYTAVLLYCYIATFVLIY